jgi:heme exporter protein B
VAGFSLVLIIIASFSFRYLGFDPRDISALSAGVIWMIFLFTAVIALNNSFAHEQAGQAMLGIVMSGVDLGTFYLSKLLVNFLLLFVMQCFVLTAQVVFFDLHLETLQLATILFVQAIAALSIISIGTILAAIATLFKGRDMVLPLILFPLTLPLSGAAVNVLRPLYLDGDFVIYGFWSVFLYAYAIISIAISYLLFEFVVSE